MLKIWYLEGVNYVKNAQMYFEHNWEDDWITDPFVKEMIKDVDKSEVIGPHLIESPVLGPIPPTTLSGGVQVLILLLKDNSKVFNISNCGDNCAKWILEIAKQKDLVVYLEHIMHFDEEFEIKIMNTNKIVRNKQEYNLELLTISDFIRRRDNLSYINE